MSIGAAEPGSAALLPASDSDVHSSAALCWHYLSQSSRIHSCCSSIVYSNNLSALSLDWQSSLSSAS